jgi:hypothetical protein
MTTGDGREARLRSMGRVPGSGSRRARRLRRAGRAYGARLSPTLDHERAAAQHEAFVAAIGRVSASCLPCRAVPPPCPAPPSPNAYASVAGFRLLLLS